MKRYILFFAILFFSLLRFINLDADAGIFKNINDISDEGHWGLPAKNLILFGKYTVDENVYYARPTPLYVASSYFFFKLFGINFFTLRLTSAVFGVLTIFLTYFFLKKYHQKLALWGAFFLAINYDFFNYNRIGLPETLVGFFILLTFYFLEHTNFWFAAGLSLALACSAKITTIWFFPVFIFYFIFKKFRLEIDKKRLIAFFSGFLIIGLPLFFYEYRYQEILVPGAKKLYGFDLFATLPLRLAELFSNNYFANPINILLLLCVIKFLERKEVIKLFSKKFKEYIKSLKSLDIVIISWILGYAVSLILFSDISSRRLQLLSPIFSITAAKLLFENYSSKIKSQNLNFLQNLILLSPFLMIGALFKEEIFLVEKFPFKEADYRTGLLALPLFIGLSMIFSRLPHQLKKMFLFTAFILFLIVITAYFDRHLFLMFDFVKRHHKIFRFLEIFTLWFLFYFSNRRSILVAAIFSVSLALIMFNMIMPTFSLKNTSEYLRKITTEKDYVIGALEHQLSYNAKYIPIDWPGDIADRKDLNDNFVKSVKPKYLLNPEFWLGKWPESLVHGEKGERLKDLGVDRFEKTYSFKLYPIFGRERIRLTLYKLFYE